MPKGVSVIAYKPETLEKRRRAKEGSKAIEATLDEISTALELTKGHIGDAADLLRVGRPALLRKINVTPSLSRLLDDIKQRKLDDAEKALDVLIEERNVTAVTFKLRTLGKDRGYSEKSTVEHELGENARSAAALIAAMRKGTVALPPMDDAVEVDSYTIGVEHE